MPRKRGRGGKRKRTCNIKRRIVDKVVKTSQSDANSLISCVSSVENSHSDQTVPCQSVTSVSSAEVNPCQSIASVSCTQEVPCQSVTSVPGTSRVSDVGAVNLSSSSALPIVPFTNGFGVIPLTGNSVINITVTDITTSSAVTETTATSAGIASLVYKTVNSASSDGGANTIESCPLTPCTASINVGNVEMQSLTQPSTSNQQNFNLPEHVVKEEIIMIDDDSDTEMKEPDFANTMGKCEKKSEKQSTQPLQTIGSGSNEDSECPVCLQPCVLPARLPCMHVFCYLCLKGIALSGQDCPMCRAPVPYYYRNNPPLLPIVSNCAQKCSDVEEKNKDEEKYFWFYEGRQGGWWQFEERMSDEIEENQRNGKTKFDMMICGQLYTIDTISCVQHPKHCPFRLRKIIRDLPSRIYQKGVAGILRRDLPSTSKQ